MSEISNNEEDRTIDGVKAGTGSGATGSTEHLEAQLRRSILKRRAIRLARPLDKPDTPPGRQYVVFVLSQQRFAFEVDFVEEVFQIKSILPVPGTPPYVVGIASLRGALISIIDLKHLCNLHEKAVMGSDKTLIVRTDSLRVGVMTDDVVGLDFIPDAEVQKETNILCHIEHRFVSGIARDGTVILNCEALFSMETLDVNQ